MAKAPHPIDIEVGNRIKARRRMMGMSQGTLADALGVTFQQVQKYEKGTNRVSASRLQKVGEVLGVPVSSFFRTSPRNRRPTLRGHSVKFPGSSKRTKVATSISRSHR